MAFGASPYFPGQGGTLNLMGQDPKQVMLPPPQAPIQAPKDRGMFGRFMGILAGQPYGEEKMGWVERLGRGADGMNAYRDQMRAEEIARQEEAKRQAIAAQLGMTGGDAALFAMDPSAALAERRDSRNFDYQQGRDQTMDARDERNFNRGVMESDRSFGLQENQFNEGVRQFGMNYDQGERRLNQDQSQFDATMGLSRDRFNEDVRQFGMNYALEQQKLRDKKAEAEAEASSLPASMRGMPAGVQSAIVKNELDQINKAQEATDAATKAATLANQFMGDAEGYAALGGGPLADLGQVFSNRTAGLKGITAEMIPMMRQAGEGIMTDADAKRYEQAVVSINKPRSANQSVADSLEAGKQNAFAYEQWLRDWQAQGGYGDQNTAQMLWDEYSRAVPLFDPETGDPVKKRMSIYDWFNSQQADTTGVGDVPDGVDPNDWKYMTEQEKALFR